MSAARNESTSGSQSTEPTPQPVLSALIMAWLILVFCGMLDALIRVWPVVTEISQNAAKPPSLPDFDLWGFPLAPSLAYLLLALAMGGLGSLLHLMRSFMYFASRRKLEWKWLPFYLLSPLVGALLALFFYFVLAGGLMTGGTNQSAMNPYGTAAVSALVGMFSKRAAFKLKELLYLLLKTKGDDPLGPDADETPQGDEKPESNSVEKKKKTNKKTGKKLKKKAPGGSRASRP